MNDIEKEMIIVIGLKLQEERNTEYISSTAFPVQGEITHHFDPIC